MTVVGVVQARAGSSRLPRKVLADIGGEPMLAKVLARLHRSSTVDEIVVATTDAPEDDAVADVAARAGARVHRGPVLDVLERFVGAVAGADERDVVVRVTADCPFVDPDVVDLCVARILDGTADFVANRLPPPHPRTYPVGLDVEVVRVAALRRAGREAVARFEREHVMPYLYGHPDRFAVEVLDLDEDLSEMRWTVDTPEDLALAVAVDALAGPEPYGWHEVLRVVREHPEIARLNQDLEQKRVDVVDARWDAPSPPGR